MTCQPGALHVRLLETIYKTDNVQILHIVLDPEQEIPWHFHSEVSDMFYVVQGPLTIIAGEPEERFSVHRGDTQRVQARRPHRVRNQTDRQVEFLLVQGIGSYDFKPTGPESHVDCSS